MSTPTTIQILDNFEYRIYLHINALCSSALFLFTGCYKSGWAQKAVMPPHSRIDSVHSWSTVSFCWGRKKETILWIYSYLIFSLLLILFLILTLYPFWKTYNSAKKGKRDLHFVATTMALKPNQTKPTQRNKQKKQISSETGSSQNIKMKQ